MKLSIILGLMILIVCAVNAFASSVSGVYRYEASSNLKSKFAKVGSLYNAEKKRCNEKYEQIKMKSSVLDAIPVWSKLSLEEEKDRINLAMAIGNYGYVSKKKVMDELTELRSSADLELIDCLNIYFRNAEEFMRRIDVVMSNATLEFNRLSNVESECVGNLNNSKQFDQVMTEPTVVACIQEVERKTTLLADDFMAAILKIGIKLDIFLNSHKEQLVPCFTKNALDRYKTKSRELVEKWKKTIEKYSWLLRSR